jgi:hypothetical protein
MASAAAGFFGAGRFERRAWTTVWDTGISVPRRRSALQGPASARRVPERNLTPHAAWWQLDFVMKAVTKAGGKKRRCQRCRKWFIPKTGGRPAKFCSASCRQRAYEARSALHTHPALQGSDIPAPQSSKKARIPLLFVGGSSEGSFFEPADAEACFEKAGKVLDGTDFSDVAAKLDVLAGVCVAASRKAGTATAREFLDRCRSMSSHAGKLLADFGLTSSFDQLITNDVVSALIVRAPLDDRRCRLLLGLMAKEVGIPGMLDPRRAFHLGLWGVQLIGCVARLLSAAPVQKALRRAPPEELLLVDRLHKLYEEVTGDDHWQTTPTDGTKEPVPSGPFVNLVSAVAGHIADRLHLVQPSPPQNLAVNMEALSNGPRRIGERIKVLRKLRELRKAQTVHDF